VPLAMESTGLTTADCLAFFAFGGSTALTLWMVALYYDTVRKALTLSVGS
jgi:hypothetical protein